MEKLSGINLVSLLIDHRERHDFSGRIINQYSDDIIEFDSCMNMLNRLEELYNDWGFPEAAVRLRSFTVHRTDLLNDKKNDSKKRLVNIAAEKKPRSIVDERGTVATFHILTEMRQHSSWQGQVLCVDSDKKFEFNSTLELLFIMDDELNSLR